MFWKITFFSRFFLSLSTNYWIGVHDIYQENYFVNMLNETVLYTKWAASQPNNVHYKYKNADCVEIASNGWVDVPCTLSMSAICSKRNNGNNFSAFFFLFSYFLSVLSYLIFVKQFKENLFLINALFRLSDLKLVSLFPTIKIKSGLLNLYFNQNKLSLESKQNF